MLQSVQPLPYCNARSVPLTITGSPILVLLNSQVALPMDMLTHPCDTFVRPCDPSDHGAACMYSPPQVSRWAYSISILYLFSGFGSCVVSKTVLRSFSITTMVPLDEGVLGLPRLTGMVLMTWPSLVTVICLVRLSTVMMNDGPTEATTVRSDRPYHPPPNGRPPVRMRKLSFVSAFQNSFGR